MVILLAVVITRGTPKIVGRLIRLRQLAHPFGLLVYVAQLRRLRSAKRQFTLPLHQVETDRDANWGILNPSICFLISFANAAALAPFTTR
jgi:hypothetical protein